MKIIKKTMNLRDMARMEFFGSSRTAEEKNNIQKNNVAVQTDTVDISREDFELLDVEQDVMYRIIEENGTVTFRKGENV